MIAWAFSQGFDQSCLRIRVHNNGGVPEEDFYFEVFMDITGRDVSITEDSLISRVECEGGLFVVTPALHRMLEPTGKAFCKWFEQQEQYLMTGKWFEEYLVVDGKVTLDTLIKIHFGAKSSYVTT